MAREDHEHPGLVKPVIRRSFGEPSYHIPGWTVASTTTTQMGTDEQYSIPIYIPVTFTYLRIMCQVTTLYAASLIRMGVYNAQIINGGLRPDALQLDAGTVDPATTGRKEITISWEATPGWYFLVFVSNGNPIVRTPAPINAFPPVSGREEWNVTDNVLDQVVYFTSSQTGVAAGGFPGTHPSPNGTYPSQRAGVYLRN